VIEKTMAEYIALRFPDISTEDMLQAIEDFLSDYGYCLADEMDFAAVQYDYFAAGSI
jgi:hypothetical protein